MDFIKKPCKHCPFRADVTPFLHPRRAEDIAYTAQNPYSTFPCHKTTETDEDGERIQTRRSKECAGMLTLRATLGVETPEGFTPAKNCYESIEDMVDAAEDEYYG